MKNPKVQVFTLEFMVLHLLHSSSHHLQLE